MLRHTFLLIFRNFKRFKTTFFINLVGLSSGLACVLMIYLWVQDEWMFDRFHGNNDRLVQVMEHQHLSDRIVTQPYTPDLLARTLAEEIPEVEMATEVTPSEWNIIFTLTANDQPIKAKGQFAGKDFFNMFSYQLMEGDANQVLADKSGMVISEDLALRLFNTTENVIGKSVRWQVQHYTREATISGVIKNVPNNSSYQHDFLIPFEVFIDKELFDRNSNWDNHAPHTIVVLKEGVDLEAFSNKIAGFIKSKSENSHTTLFAVPFADNYLYGNYENGAQAGGRITYIKLFSIIAIFILVIACINFMNLSTAKASRRIKEVGVKKAIGAHRKTLVYQYLTESMLVTVISLLVALVIVQILLPQFNLITGKQLVLHIDLNLIKLLLAVTIITGLLAGSYPAIYLSGFKPAIILKGKLNSSRAELWSRRGLVVFQFALSIMFIVGVMVVYNQTKFIQTKNLGYNKDNIIYFDQEGKIPESLEAFLSEVRNITGVVNASSIAQMFEEEGSTTTGIEWQGKNPDDDIRFENVGVNYGMIETLGVELLEGRTFSKEFTSDTASLIMNEAAIQVMGLADPIGATIKLWGKENRIVGIVKDFHFESLHQTVKPLFFRLVPTETMKVLVKLEAGKEQETLANLSALYTTFNPGYAFDYNFLDKAYQTQYVSEQRVATLSKYFAGLAILISCLGLFGLAAFTAERRLKEIGIRKVLGSSVFSIVYLLSQDFTKMVGVAIVIALPISYFISKQWLDGFAYRVTLEWWYFVGAGIVALVIAWITVGSQAIKAANVNPSQCLKDE